MPEELMKQQRQAMLDGTDELYNEYTSLILDLIFNSEVGEKKPNTLGNAHETHRNYRTTDMSRKDRKRLEKAVKAQCGEAPCHVEPIFYDDLAIVSRYIPAEYNIVDRTGKIRLNNWTSNKPQFNSNSVVISGNNGTIFIYEDDLENPVETFRWTNTPGDYHDGFTIVDQNNYIDKEGMYLFNPPFYRGLVELSKFSEGMACIKSGDSIDFIDTKGKPLFGSFTVKELGPYHDTDPYTVWTGNSPYCDCGSFHNGYARVQSKETNKWNYIDKTGKVLLSEWYDEVYDMTQGIARVRNGKQIKEIYVGMGDYQVSKKGGKYVCTKGPIEIKLDRQPVKEFNERYILCIKEDTYYIYDKFNDKYMELGYYQNIRYTDYIIYDGNEGIYWLVYGDEIIDITTYYKNNLQDRDTLTVCPGIPGLLPLDVFMALDHAKVDAKMREIKDMYLKKHQQLQNQASKEKLEEAKKQYEEAEKQRLKELEEAYKEKAELERKIEELSMPKPPKNRRPVEGELFIQVGDHLEINPYYINEGLMFFDLSLFSFDNVKMSNIDFSFCNLSKFNPQTVYNKDLSGSNFEFVHLDPLINFEGVNIIGCRFSQDTDPGTLDFFPTFDKAIFDDTTTYNGFPIRVIMEEKERERQRKENPAEPEIPKLKI